MRGTAVLLRAAGWPAIIGLTVCAALVGGAALTFAGRVGTSAPLLDVAVALLAAAGGFALEEPAAAVVDLTPTRSSRLTAARAAALLPPVLTGCALALFATRSSGLPTLDLSVTLLGSSILGFTLADVARQRIDEPGAVVAVRGRPARRGDPDDRCRRAARSHRSDHRPPYPRRVQQRHLGNRDRRHASSRSP